MDHGYGDGGVVVVEVGGEHARGVCLVEHARGGRLVEWRGGGLGVRLVRGVVVVLGRGGEGTFGDRRGVVRGGVAAGTAGRATRGGEDTRRDVGEETRRDVGEARARVARAPEGEVARASSSAMRRRLALASVGGRARSRRYADGWTPRGSSPRWREGPSIDGTRAARVSVVGVCRGGRSVGGIGERASQRRGRSKHAGARGTTSDAGRTEAVGAGAASDAARVDRRGDVRVGVGLTIASDDADSRERVSRSARRIRPCPPTIARGGGRNTRTSRSKGNDRLFLESRGTN